MVARQTAQVKRHFQEESDKRLKASNERVMTELNEAKDRLLKA